MDRENEKVVAEEGRTKLEKKLQQRRGENAKAQPNAQKYSGLICARQRTERKDKRRKRKLKKRKTFLRDGMDRAAPKRARVRQPHLR